MEKFENVKYICGIDTLYYFCETLKNYDDLFLDIIDQIEEKKGQFEKKEIECVDKDIHISINHITLDYLSKSEGFHWFSDINEFFKIGFKDPLTNRGLHDIRVQLLGNGIYTIGIKSIIEFVDTMLEGFIRQEHPITRMDLNCFIQYDFGFVDKRMFVSRKRKYSSIGDIGTANNTQTLYVGKPPFKLRVYDKSLELRQSKKQELMREYFKLHDFDMDQPIFNVEFEMHRTHLRSYEITTIEEAFEKATPLFKEAMDDIRLIDLGSISQSDIENNNKNRAVTLPIWDFVKQIYTINEFLQVTSPLERVKRRAYVYTEMHFEKEYKTLIRKGLLNSIPITKELLEKNLYEALEELCEPKRPLSKPAHYTKDFIPLEFDDGYKKQEFRLLKNGQLIKPVNIMSVTKMSDKDLLSYIEDIKKDFQNEDINFDETNKLYKVAYDEAVRRKLMPYIPF